MFQPVAAKPLNAELWWTVYLRSRLIDRIESYAQDVKVGRDVPNPRPRRLVTVAKDGGNVTGVFDRPRIRIGVWADSEINAEDLARLIIALALDAPGTEGCVRVQHLSGPNEVADPSGQPRRLSLIEATHRVALLT